MTRPIAYLAAALTLIGALSPPSLAGDKPEALATATLVIEARAVLERAPIDKAAEKYLEQIVLTLGSRSASPAARALVEELSARAPQIFVAHEEGNVLIPFVDVGAAARVTQRNWARRAAHETASQAIRAGNTALLTDYFAADPVRQAGIVDAVSEAKAQNLVLYRDELLNRMAGPGGDRLAAAFAKSLTDTALLERVIVAGSSAVALDTIKTLEQTFGANGALTLMRLALDRPDIASAALYEIGRLTPTLPAAQLLLWESLPDPELGGSAAAVLARNADSATVMRLADLLHDSDDRLVRKRALLALRLSGDPRAARIASDWLNRTPAGAR